MSNSYKCPHCQHWIFPMEVHQDCQRKQEEKRIADAIPSPMKAFGWICPCGHRNQEPDRWLELCGGCGHSFESTRRA